MTQRAQNVPGGPRERGQAEPAFTPPDPSQQPDTSAPGWLHPEALPAWRAAVDLLCSVRIIAKSDLTALSRYCQLLYEWIKLTDAISADGHVVEDSKGGVKLNPACQARDGIERGIRSLEKALGLDPVSHAALTSQLHRALTDRNKARGGRKSPGGFLNKRSKDNA